MENEISHVKHPKLTLAKRGFFGRDTLSILGSPCSVIQSFGRKLQLALMDSHTTVWVDQDHAYFDTDIKSDTNFIARATQTFPDDWQINELFPQEHIHPESSAKADLALINGNHFQTDNEWILFHPSKLKSLERKMDRVKNAKRWIISSEYLSLVNHLMNPKAIIIAPENDQLIIQTLKESCPVPPLKALILAGGKSTRMGTDKRYLNYHGRPQQEFACNLTEEAGLPTFFSVSHEGNDANESSIQDRYIGLGPLGGILSAMMKDPNSAWLVLACDLPAFDQEALKCLINERKTGKHATAFLNEQTGFPDPLCTIYEPKMYPKMLQFLAMGYSCPRKALINSTIQMVKAEKQEWLENVNTPEQFREIKSRMG